MTIFNIGTKTLNEYELIADSKCILGFFFAFTDAPEIKTESSCSVEGNWVKCECIVNSNPASTVTFKHSDKILPGTTRDKNGFYTIKILWKDIEPSKFVQCLASNIEGKASHTLSVPHDGMK